MKDRFTYWLPSLLVSMLFLQGSAWPQAQSSIQRVTGKGKEIIVHEQENDHVYDFSSDLKLYEVKNVKLLFQNRANGQLYLLVDVVGPSTAGGNTYCGAGQEEYLIWQALDSKWGQGDHKVEPIASCLVSIESSEDGDPYDISQGTLTAEYINYTDKTTETLSYDSTKPEKAWTIRRKPIPASPQH
jgi:hypothetical protein